MWIETIYHLQAYRDYTGTLKGGHPMLFITIVLSIPAYGFFIWGLYEPEEAMLFMDKWRYEELPEFSKMQLILYKIGNIGGVILLTLFIMGVAYNTFF